MNKAAFLIILLYWGCTIFRTEYQWTDLPGEYYAIPPFAKYLQGMRIVLDPGHGGQGDIPGYKRGPSGVREAEINLRVALFLKDLLEKAGAEVLLTRSDDSYISLADRADFANHSGADFMISIHHNASGNASTNYTSIYYHKDAGLSPASIDLARTIYFSLVEALHLPQISEDGLHSDQLIFPDGFGLLRRCEIPAILVESSFFSNVQEERRLKKKDYNKREAYGIFLGLARYAAGGIPYAKLIFPVAAVSRSKTPSIQFRLFDGLRERRGPDSSRLRIFPDDITARLDGKMVKPFFDKDKESLFFQTDIPLSNGSHYVELFFQNMYKNHNLPKKHEIIIASPCKKINYDLPVKQFPVQGEGFLPMNIEFLDQDSTPVWDGTEIEIWSNQSQIEWIDSTLTDGKCRVYLYPGNKKDSLWIYSKADSCMDSLKIDFVMQGVTIVEGAIINQLDNSILSQVEIYHQDTLLTQTDAYGKFFVFDVKPVVYPLKFHKPGFFIQYDTVEVKENNVHQYDVKLAPVDSGIFFGQTIILDLPCVGEWNNNKAPDSIRWLDLNYRLVKELADSLQYAGANPVLIREAKDSNLSVKERIQRVNSIEKGWFMKVAVQPSRNEMNMIRITGYPANREARTISEALAAVFKEQDYQTIITESTTIPEIRNTNKTALVVDLMMKNKQDVKRIVHWFYKVLKKYYRMEQIDCN
jgi:N-acetylmuramoyl-L-alanine amidase